MSDSESYDDGVPDVAQNDPLPEKCANEIWRTPRRALSFLVFLGIAMMPLQCADGHEWKPQHKGNSMMMICRAPKQKYIVNGDD